MAKRRRRLQDEDSEEPEKVRKTDKKDRSESSSSRGRGLSREERRKHYQRRQDLTLGVVLLFIIAGLLGFYYFYDDIFPDDDEGTGSNPEGWEPGGGTPDQPNGNDIYDYPTPEPSVATNTVVVMKVENYGTMLIELYDNKNIPKTVKNFKDYVEADFYDGTIFHRVPQNPKVVQGGGYTPSGYKDPLYSEIPLEIDPTLLHVDGSVAMARGYDRDSASSQFYINVDDVNHGLDGDYAVFGQVIWGHEVYRAINKVAVDTNNNDKPLTDVVILEAHIYEG